MLSTYDVIISQVTSVKWHPLQPEVLAGSGYGGQMFLIDRRSGALGQVNVPSKVRYLVYFVSVLG